MALLRCARRLCGRHAKSINGVVWILPRRGVTYLDDIFLQNWMTSGKPVVEVCWRVRRIWPHLGALFLLHRAQQVDQVTLDHHLIGFNI